MWQHLMRIIFLSISKGGYLHDTFGGMSPPEMVDKNFNGKSADASMLAPLEKKNRVICGPSDESIRFEKIWSYEEILLRNCIAQA